jgi:peroxiredoxin
VAQLRRREAAFTRLGARVVLVGLGTVRETEIFKTRFDVPFDMLSDPQRRLFKAFELRRGTPSELLSVGTVVKGLSAMFRGYRMGAPQGDVNQLPGVFVIDTAGSVRFSHYARDASDHPDPAVILEVLRTEWNPRAAAAAGEE